ncbi:MAG TPA: DciA family protein [Thermomonas sp.]|jgi:hypothetical protein|uniref:DUF721 domain-containing protein n=1 Tax=Thermomonas beijingensis TaxID=2872701 RepID=A0ABS7TAT6_9GAMM|nr:MULTISPECIES: DciA family protein [Thermomonas]MBZ4184928.1 DUF721 domain-containing protein [Thermomonas beijingensis]HQA02058.1 DciA family protein [Thermomonas sp.]HQQ59549.1 DciA family protein [Thermomonas sp.]
MSRSTPPNQAAPPAGPRAALDTLLAGKAGGTLRRARWLDAVDQLLRPALPAGVNAHARLANLRGKTLVFIADAPVWHAKLRLATPELIAAARSIGLEVDAVTIKLATRPWQPHPATITPRIPPSAASQKGLAAALALLRAPAAEDADSLHNTATAGVRAPRS